MQEKEYKQMLNDVMGATWFNQDGFVDVRETTNSLIAQGYRKADEVRKESIKNFAEILMGLFQEDYKGEKTRRSDVRECIKTVAKVQYGVEVDE